MTAACAIRAWVQDQETKNCMACKLKFTAVRRRVSGISQLAFKEAQETARKVLL